MLGRSPELPRSTTDSSLGTSPATFVGSARQLRDSLPLRIAFDMDGVLADMDSELLRLAEQLFGADAIRRRPNPTGVHPATQAIELTAETMSDAVGTKRDTTTDMAGPEPDRVTDAGATPEVPELQLTSRQHRRLWRHVGTIEDFWEALPEIEPGSVSRLAALAIERRWEIIFLTKRPRSAGGTSQLQTQRWLEAKGFRLPSVYVVQGSRGRIAAALGLDIVVDDRPENCLDVAVDSQARAILVWRTDQPAPAAAPRLGIGVVTSFAECLDILMQIDTPRSEKPKVMDRVMRLLGLKETASAREA
jgi:hypothetical protein